MPSRKPDSTKPRQTRRSSKDKLTIEQVLRWAKAHYRRTGRWPHDASGAVLGAPGETWGAIQTALREGYRGLPGGATLARLLDDNFPEARPLLHLRPPLTTQQILVWAKAYHQRTGQWPTQKSGYVSGVPGESWVAINLALRGGYRGLPGGISLAQFLHENLPEARPFLGLRPRLNVKQILAWAKTHHRRTGQWPAARSGPVYGVPGETWGAINCALRGGLRGLPGSISLARFLHENLLEARPFLHLQPPLTPKQILAWAKTHHQRTGQWPSGKAGSVLGAPGVTWRAIEAALRDGFRGLPGGTTLARFLNENLPGPRPRRRSRRPLTAEQILAWAKAHHRRTGQWPNQGSGHVTGVPGETWCATNAALQGGYRGLSEGVSLAQFLYESVPEARPFLGVRPLLNAKQILAWAKTHHQRTGKWPRDSSGPVFGVLGETWAAVYSALRDGRRGLPRGMTLPRLLDENFPETRTIRRRPSKPAPRSSRSARAASERTQRKLALKEIMMWAEAHYRRTGEWPERYSGRIPDAPGETWLRVDDALQQGTRGLTGGSSLEQLLGSRRKPLSLAALVTKLARER